MTMPPRWDYDPEAFYRADFEYVPFTLEQCQICQALLEPQPWVLEKHYAWHKKLGDVE